MMVLAIVRPFRPILTVMPGIIIPFTPTRAQASIKVAIARRPTLTTILNTGTGIQSQATCSGGTGYNCSGGTWTMATQGRTLIATDNCGFFIHNDKGSYMMDYPVVVSQSGVPGASCSSTGDGRSWVPFQTFNSTTTAQKYRAALNHWTVGNTHLWTLARIASTTASGTADVRSGTYGYATARSELTRSPRLTAFRSSIGEPTCTNSWSPGNALPPCESGSSLRLAHELGLQSIGQ